jgi:hypothetical protein
LINRGTPNCIDLSFLGVGVRPRELISLWLTPNRELVQARQRHRLICGGEPRPCRCVFHSGLAIQMVPRCKCQSLLFGLV